MAILAADDAGYSRLMRTVHIRPARVAEAAALSALCFRSKAVWGYDEGFMAMCREGLAVKPGEIAAGDVWVAIDTDGEPAGVVSLAPGADANTLDLGKLFIEPGRLRAGIGRALLEHAVAEAWRRGAKRLTILADPNAAGFYEGHGAVLVGKAPSDAIPGRAVPLYEIRLAMARP